MAATTVIYAGRVFDGRDLLPGERHAIVVRDGRVIEIRERRKKFVVGAT